MKLEQDRFQNRTPDFIYMLVFSMVALLVLALGVSRFTSATAGYVIAREKSQTGRGADRLSKTSLSTNSSANATVALHLCHAASLDACVE